MNVKLSIGIPTYNQGMYLEKAIVSILNQSIKPYEVVVCNNHSNDGFTETVLNKYKDQINIIQPPVFLTMMENWNYLCKNLTGTHISLLSSDDFYESNFVSTFMDIYKPDGVLYRFGFNLIDDSDTIIETKKINSVNKMECFPRNFYEQIQGPKLSFSAFVVSSVNLKEVGYFDENLKLIGDWGLWLKLSPLGKFYYSEESVSNYRIDYRNKIAKERFELNISDFIYVYGTIQRNLIEKYKLKKTIFNNAIKLHLYKIEKIRKENTLINPSNLMHLKKLTKGRLIRNDFEFIIRNFYQNFREYFFKI